MGDEARTEEHTDIPNIAAQMLDDMPMPSQHAIDAAVESQEATESAPVSDGSIAQEFDNAGEAWNPEIHATGADGHGSKTAKGLWRRRRGLAFARTSSVAREKRAGVPPTASVSDVQARAAGVACAHTLFVVGRAIGGDEWSPRDDGDHSETKLMETAFGDYFVATGRTEFPPGLALTLAVSAYALPRFTMPQTKSRMTRAKQWIAGKWIAYKDRKKPKDSERTVSRAMES